MSNSKRLVISLIAGVASLASITAATAREQVSPNQARAPAQELQLAQAPGGGAPQNKSAGSGAAGGSAGNKGSAGAGRANSGGGGNIGRAPRQSSGIQRPSGGPSNRAVQRSGREGGAVRVRPPADRPAISTPRVRDGVSRNVETRSRVDGRRRPGATHGRHRGTRFYWGSGGEFWFFDGFYHGDCQWLRRKAVQTGSQYWWRRFRQCRAYY